MYCMFRMCCGSTSTVKLYCHLTVTTMSSKNSSDRCINKNNAKDESNGVIRFTCNSSETKKLEVDFVKSDDSTRYHQEGERERDGGISQVPQSTNQ